jgi:hypothetical protein
MGQLLGTGRDWTLTVAPNPTNHSAFDAYMLLFESVGKRLLYSSDFLRIAPI